MYCLKKKDRTFPHEQSSKLDLNQAFQTLFLGQLGIIYKKKIQCAFFVVLFLKLLFQGLKITERRSEVLCTIEKR